MPHQERHATILAVVERYFPILGAEQADDAMRAARVIMEGTVAPGSYIDSTIEPQIRNERGTLVSFSRSPMEGEQTPDKDAIACTGYSVTIEDREVPAAPGRLFVRVIEGAVCSWPANDNRGLILGHLSVSQRYSRELGHEPIDTLAMRKEVLPTLRLE